MEGSLDKWYQDEALMEGKKITTSILPLAIGLREIGRSKKQEARSKKKNPRAGLELLFVQRKLQEEKEEKGLLLI